MPELLFLAHRIPYPPNKGDKIRSWNILRYLARDHRVHLGCFVDDAADRRFEPVLREICESCHFAALDPRIARLRSLRGLAAGAPLTLGYFRDRGLGAWVSALLDRRQIERVFVFSSSMAQYAPRADIGAARLVVDFVDVDSDKWRQYAASKRWPASWVYRREARALLAFERSTAAAADASLFVSAAEADLFRRLAPECAATVAAVNNGVDFGYFDPGRDYGNPFRAGTDPIVFTGAMDYWANVDAVGWFAREVLPGIVRRHREASFCIVGAKPASAVRRLAELPAVTVTGAVPDVRPYLAHAALVVAPLRLARGIQNKVLEAMAMARPVLATPEALEGIDAEPGREVFTASGATALAEAAARILADRNHAEFGRRARARVVAGYGWDANLTLVREIFS